MLSGIYANLKQDATIFINNFENVFCTLTALTVLTVSAVSAVSIIIQNKN